MPGSNRIGTNALAGALGEWSLGPASSLQGKLADAIRQVVRTGVLAPGSVLPAERSMAKALAVSRSTVTSALNELKDEGILEARQGSGTIVVGVAVQESLGATVLPGILGISNGRYSADAFKVGSIDLAASTPADARALPAMNIDFDALLRAGPRHGYTPEGLPALRDAVAQRLTIGGLPTALDQVLITNGAQHGLALAFNLLTNEGDRVLVDEPTYPGLIDLLAARNLKGIGLARTAGGVDVSKLGDLVVSHDIKVSYLQTSVHNPTGMVAADWEFRALARKCDELELTVLEDMVLADLRYDGLLPAPIAARTRSATVLAIGSLSKLGWGGLRIGWMRAPAELFDRLVRARLSDDLGSSIPSQVIAAGVLANFDEVARLRRSTLAARAELAISVLAERLPEWSVKIPAGGLSLWVKLPAAVGEPLAQVSARHGVTIATGTSASVEGAFSDHVRLCFDRPEAQLLQGLERLVTAWKTLM